MRSILFRRDVVGWCLYDWANSAFVTSITVVLLPLYFPGLFADPKDVPVDLLGATWHTSSDALWSYSNSVYMILLAIAAPVLGAIADAARGKKRFLALATAVGGLATMALALTGPGQWGAVVSLYVLAAFLWGAGNIFYDGFLPELTGDPGEMDAISGAGYGVGYLGGALMLVVNLVVLAGAGADDPASVARLVRLNFVLVGAWWILFTVPMLLWVKEAGAGAARAGGHVREGFRRLRATLGKIRRLPELMKFLVAFFLYNSGVGTIIIVAATYARSELGIAAKTIVLCLLMIQVVGLPAAFGYIWLAKRVGTRSSLFIGIAVYAAVVVYAMQITTTAEFWVLGFLIALVQGGTQAMSRSLFGSMLPEGMSAEFYGFFSVFNKVGPFLGPLAFGIARDLTRSSRLAILFLVAFFFLGYLALWLVSPDRGREQARAFMEHPGSER